MKRASKSAAVLLALVLCLVLFPAHTLAAMGAVGIQADLPDNPELTMDTSVIGFAGQHDHHGAA